MSRLPAAVRTILTGVVIGALGLGSAVAATLVMDAPAEPRSLTDGGGEPGVGEAQVPAIADELAPTVPVVGSGVADADLPPGVLQALTNGRLQGGWFRAGTGTASLLPDPDTWVEGEDCSGTAPEQLYTPLTPEGCLITFDMRWADGFDEQNPIEARSMAVGNGEDVVVLTLMDTVGYMASYPAGTCDRCGLDEIAEDLAAETGLAKESFAFTSSHTHAAPSTIADGPAWYYDQVRDALKDAVRASLADAATNPPVRIEHGSVRARALNTDRRIVDRAVPDDELVWVRAFVPGSGRTVATLGNFSVHATVRAGNAELHSGAIGPFVRHLNDELGGGAVWFPAGLGDQKVDRGYGINGLGIGMAQLIVDDVRGGNGTQLQSNDVEMARTTVQIPVENQFFAGALAVGYAIRNIEAPYGGGPLAVNPTVGGANAPSCSGAGEVHVVGSVTGIRLGERPAAGKVEFGEEYALPVPTDNITIIQSPGEMFASMSLIVKDYLSRSSGVVVTSLTNDTLGYMVPSNQFDLTGSQGLGVANNVTGTGNYEEALSLGQCTGDIVMNAMLEVATELGVMGEGEGR